MRTERLAFDEAGVARAAELLRRGRLVAFPTETVYGLGARADDAEAVRGIFRAKGRPPTNPLIVHVASIEAARALAAEWPEAAERVARAYWPGPLTLVVARREGRVAPEVTAGGPTVAIRIPAHPAALAVLGACGLPIAAPSANLSTSVSPTTAEHVWKGLAGRIDAVLDAGATPHGIESTIVDASVTPPRLRRHGAIPLGAIAAHVEVRDAATAVVPVSEVAPAPGQHERHYAPRARVVLVPPGAVAAEASARAARGERVGTIVRDAGEARGPLAFVLPSDPAGYAARLYATLHALDDAACDAVVVAAVPDDAAWAAVRDRLRRAAA